MVARPSLKRIRAVSRALRQAGVRRYVERPDGSVEMDLDPLPPRQEVNGHVTREPGDEDEEEADRPEPRRKPRGMFVPPIPKVNDGS